MTRDKIKRMVALKITEKLMINHRLPEAMEAAEEIMKIWDKGFAYEVPNKYYDPPFNIGNCCKNGVCTCGP